MGKTHRPPAGQLPAAYGEISPAVGRRVHATCFHQGTTSLGPAGVVRCRGCRARLDQIVQEQLSPMGRLQVNTALSVMQALDEHLDRLRRRIVSTAQHVAGARALSDAIYGVGLMAGLALVAWLAGANRFSSSRKAVRFVGLDITVRSTDSKRSPGRLSRQGPEVLRWLLFEAAKTCARDWAPAHAYYDAVRQRYDGNRAALSHARRIIRQAAHILTGLGDDAFTFLADLVARDFAPRPRSRSGACTDRDRNNTARRRTRRARRRA